jgi:hypothetical protein
VNYIRGTLWERFWPKVDAAGPCWEWTANTTDDGYGRIWSGPEEDRLLLAHRVAWTLLVGEIPEGLELDHLCRNHACVNPDHLEPVSGLVNQNRGFKPKKTHCPKGHAYTPENTSIRKRGNGISRGCRTCARASAKRSNDKKAREVRMAKEQKVLVGA